MWTSICPSQRGSLSRPKRPKRGAKFRAEELRLFPRCEVPAFVDLLEIDQVAVSAPGPFLRPPIDVSRKPRDFDGKRDLAGLLRGCNNDAASCAVLPVQ